MDRPGVRQVPGGNGEQRKMEETGYEIICGAPAILGVKNDDYDETIRARFTISSVLFSSSFLYNL